MLQIEAGKYYRTREGKKVGLASRDPMWAERWSLKQGYLYTADGKYLGGTVDLDLIEEWSDEPAKPALPKFDVEKLEDIFDDAIENCPTDSETHRKGILAVAEEAVRQYLNPPKDPVEVLAEKLRDLRNRAYSDGAPSYSEALARHILETYPDAHERL